MSTRSPYEKFRHTLHVLRLATLGDAHQFSIAQLTMRAICSSNSAVWYFT
jgi:hypothetical protein